MCSTAAARSVGPRAPSLFRAAVALGCAIGAGAAALAAPPANDFCTAPVDLSLDAPVAGTTVEAQNDYRLGSAGGCFTGVGQVTSPAAGRDVVYRFTAPAAGSYSFRVTHYATTADLVLFVASSCPTTGTTPILVTTCVGGANRSSSSTAEEAACLPLAGGQEVFAFVDEHTLSSSGSPFTIEVVRCTWETEPNDAPASASARACPVEGSIAPAGDFDFFGLGAPAAASRVFALVDGVAANSSDFDLRVTTSTGTLEYDDADNDAPFGAASPNVAGTPLTGVESYLRVNHHQTPAIQAEPYRLYAAVQPTPASATNESEPNDTSAQADIAPNAYFRGAIGTSADVDVFRVDVVAGDLVMLGLDADPLRNNTPGNLSLAVLDPVGAVLESVDDPDASSDPTPGAGSLSSLTPRSPAEGIVVRAPATGALYVRVAGAPGTDYLLSAAIDCRVLPATDLALTLGATPECVANGQTLSYTATVVNAGAAPARNVVLDDPLPADVSYVSATPSQGACQGGATVVCHLGDIPATASATVTIQVIAGTSGLIVNSASVSSDVVDSNAANDVATASTNGPCSDGNVCTTGDTCSGGTCVGGAPLDCSDTNPCTDDLCSPTSGCAHPFNTAPCDDGNPCSSGDVCRAGACEPGACHGTCPGSGEECVQDEFEQCVCANAAAPCGGTAPFCAGECPTGSLCVQQGTGTGCQCEPIPPCGSAAGPQCAGTCPAGSECQPTLSPTSDCACVPAEVPCETSGFPTCSGSCDEGYECAANGTECNCAPAQPDCGSAAAPRCAGSCGPGGYCRPDATWTDCVCALLDVACGAAIAPACGGHCGDDQLCVPGTGGVCVCESPDCGDSMFPECGGACPAGSTCHGDASSGACACAPDDPQSCGSSSAPECGGVCAAGLTCEADATGSYCQCVPDEVPCALASAPACAGDCPGDYVCSEGPSGCVCTPPVIDCGDQLAPACNGNCPDGRRCEPAILGDGCWCVVPDPECGDARAPWCNGDCPFLTQCLPNGSSGACSCQGCGLTPPAPDITLLWGSHTRLDWSHSVCATTYDVYMFTGPALVDADDDGVADDYGTCQFSSLATEYAIETTSPPPGSMFAFLVTGANAVGEGSLGYTGGNLLRPNLSPCP